jgi:hypothetical protein
MDTEIHDTKNVFVVAIFLKFKRKSTQRRVTFVKNVKKLNINTFYLVESNNFDGAPATE